MMFSNPYLFYAVTDPKYTAKQSLTQLVESAIHGGVTCVQLRDKTADKQALYHKACELKAVTDRYGIPLIINDHVEIAKAVDAAGVHIGQTDGSVSLARKLLGEDKIIGVSARTAEQALKAQTEGASYLGCGAVFGTNTKADAKPLSFAALQEICAAVDIPVVAIGGVSHENVSKLRGCGISGAAFVSAVFDTPDVENRCRLIRKMMEQVVEI